MALTTAPVELVSLDGTVTINDSSADADFRVEGDSDTHALFVQASDGSVGIGASSPTFGSGSGLEVSRSGTATLRVERTGSTASSGEFFAGNGKVVLSSISNNHLEFRTNNTEVARIDSSGNLLVGTTDTTQFSNASGADHGIVLSANNYIDISRNDNPMLYLNRTDGDGQLAFFSREGSGVGAIGITTSDLVIFSTTASHVGLRFGNTRLQPTDNTGATSDGASDLGFSNSRFKDLYLSGTANVGTQVKFPSVSYDDRSIGLDSGGFYLYNNGDSRYDFHVDGNGALKAVGSYGSKINANDSYHELSVGGGGSGLAVYIFNNNTSGSAILANANGNVGNSNCYLFRGYSGSASQDNFYIYSNGSTDSRTGTYGTMSDVKLKQDIEDASSQWDDVKAFRFRKYRLKSEVEADPNTGYHLGVIAQELELTSPNLVTENPDLDDKNNDLGTTTKAVKTSILLMKTAKALQEAMERIETLEAEVAALKGE